MMFCIPSADMAMNVPPTHDVDLPGIHPHDILWAPNANHGMALNDLDIARRFNAALVQVHPTPSALTPLATALAEQKQETQRWISMFGKSDMKGFN